MKAIQLRSPLHLYFNTLLLSSVNVEIYINSNLTLIDVDTTPDYTLTGTAFNNECTFEIAELIRSKNQYYYESEFYTNRDTSTYVYIKCNLLDVDGVSLEYQHKFYRVRDGYLEREEDIQLYNNRISTKIEEWIGNSNVTLTENVADPFNGLLAYRGQPTTGTDYILSQNIKVDGVHTFSIWIKSADTMTIENAFDYNASTQIISNVNVNIIAYDVIKLNSDWDLVSFVYDFTKLTRLRIENITTDATFFNPCVIKGNWINQDSSENLLQSNTDIYTSGIAMKIMVDRKYSVANDYNGTDIKPFFDNNNERQALVLGATTADVTMTDRANVNSTTSIVVNDICEVKYTPAKVSFVNKFGVIQDVVFFKKRVDEVSTKEENYKANIIQSGGYLQHTGQKQILSKTAQKSVKLNSGFYPESFNTVFEQLLSSLYYWIDDQPAVLTSSRWTEKTNVNDKLINYTFDFDYSNEEINNVR